uniref:Uncharacterized protein n=1 Tax=Tanacetum cinerariifolium TaxID=118510 RepID=A0A6L2LXI2_TANCI|nr:hypothetical protein [Tanacetum cinerariifolium]
MSDIIVYIFNDRITTDSGHSTVSYTSISSPERSWDILDVDPYEEAALQTIEQYPEYLEPPADDIVAEDQPHVDNSVPTALSPGYITDSNP